MLAGVAVMILTLPLNGYIATKIKTFQVKQMGQKDNRVKVINEVLGGIKVSDLVLYCGFI